MINKESVKELIVSLRDTDITELAFEKDDFKIFLRKDTHAGVRKSPVKNELPGSASSDQQQEQSAKKLTEIRSTMVGTFHASSANRPPLVIEGDHVMPGQKIGIIEAMKVMKDVISTVQGKVEKVVITDSHAVEYGQTLFLIDVQLNNKK